MKIDKNNDELWDAIYEYLSENDPDGDPTRPLLAPAKIERIIRKYRAAAWREGVNDATENISGDERSYVAAGCRAINPYITNDHDQ